MKKITFWMMLSFFATTFFFSSCGDDIADEMEEIEEMMEEEEEEEEETVNTVITVSDLTTDIDEVTNRDGEFEEIVVGTLSASVNVGTLSFSIKSQTPADAIKVDEFGKVTADILTGWDFETNTSINAIIEAKAGLVTKDINVTINLNNIVEHVELEATSEVIIPENTTFDSYIVAYTAQSDGAVEYSISSNDYFEIDNEGKVFLKDGVNLDYEALTANGGSADLAYIITAFAVDNPQISDEIGFNPTITDVEGNNEVEERLAAGQTPAQIVAINANFQDSLYGAPYQGGIIATYNNGSGLIMTIAGSGTDRTWSQSNAFANNLVKDGFSDWRLMTEAEADIMCAYGTKVSENNTDGFWTSTACGGICYVWKHFTQADLCGGGGSPNSNPWSIVRAVRTY